jgi:hypothetical protein
VGRDWGAWQVGSIEGVPFMIKPQQFVKNISRLGMKRGRGCTNWKDEVGEGCGFVGMVGWGLIKEHKCRQKLRRFATCLTHV